MKVVLTGGTGFIGQYALMEMLSKTDWSFICLSNKNSFDGLVSDFRVRYLHLGYEVTNPWGGILKDIDAFVHLGSTVLSNYQSEDEFERNCLSGIDYADDIFRVCHKAGVKNIVFASSIAVYGDNTTESNRLFSEDTVLNPMSIYGATKAAIENIACFYNQHYGMKIKSLRIGQSFGARSSVKNNFLKACQDSCMNNSPVKIYGEGKTSQDYVYVKDVARAIRLAIEHGEASGSFNVGSGRLTSTLEMGKAFCTGFHNASGIKFEPYEENLHFNCMDISKSQRLLGYVPEYHPIDACCDMYNMYKKGMTPSC